MANLYSTDYSPQTLASDTAESNLAASSYITQLDQLINSLNQSAQQTANMGRIPGEADLEQQSSADISSELKGQLNPGTVSTIQDSMAQRYGSTGFGADSAAISAAAERAMGLTAENQVQTGQANLTSATARNPAATVYGAQNLLATPSDYLSAQNANRAASANNAAASANNAAASAKTPSGSGYGGTPSGTQPKSPTSATQNFAGGGTSTAPATTENGTTSDRSSYNPGGSSVFGLINTGDGNYLDMFDSSGLFGTVFPSYGSTPDYSGFANTGDNPYLPYDTSSWATSDYGSGAGNTLSETGIQFGMDTTGTANSDWNTYDYNQYSDDYNQYSDDYDQYSGDY